MKRKPLAVLLLIIICLAACTGTPAQNGNSPQLSTEQAGDSVGPTRPAEPVHTPTAGDMTPTTNPESQPVTPVYPDFDGEVLVSERGEWFSGAGACAFCHTNQRDAAGGDIAIDRRWSASILANAGKDPYWLATVRSEVELEPELREVIEQKCASCHMPMAEVSAEAVGDSAMLLDGGFTSANHSLRGLALDGVSCNVCHQIERDNFGQQVSFSGGFLIDLAAPSGSRKSYGPYQVGNQLANLMQGASGYVPQQAAHTSQSELCGTCHNLVTPYVDAEGQIAGEFPEQAIYSEWLNSRYQENQSCMDCHMPAAENAVQLSITGGSQRSPFSKHIFAGGNAFMLNILRLYGEEIGVTTSSANLALAAQAAEELMGTQTARLSLENADIKEGNLNGEVIIESLVGHKFPAGYPSRRAWLHITVLDGSGKLIFESGQVSPDGRITGNANDEDASAYEPHYTVISSPDQVQIYETVMLNSDGAVTTTLLRAASYAKDNRILPQGFNVGQASEDTLVFGEADKDDSFLPGGDRLILHIDLGDAVGPYSIKVELLYQSIGYRWAQNLLADQTPEAQTFGRYYNNVPNLPLVAASAEMRIQP
jgi:hypothetical protein